MSWTATAWKNPRLRGADAWSGRRGRPASAEPKEVSLGEITVNKRGSLVLPRSLVEQLGVGAEDLFMIRRTKSGMLLKPV